MGAGGGGGLLLLACAAAYFLRSKKKASPAGDRELGAEGRDGEDAKETPLPSSSSSALTAGADSRDALSHASVVNPLHAAAGAAGAGAAAASMGAAAGMGAAAAPMGNAAPPAPAALPPGWFRRGPNEDGQFWYDLPARNHTQWDPPPPDLPSALSQTSIDMAEEQWKDGHGELPPEWDYKETAGGEVYFVRPDGETTWDDPRDTLFGYTLEFFAAEARGVNLARYFGAF